MEAPNYTAHAAHALELAESAARWCRHESVGPGHVLLGLTRVRAGAFDILQDVGADERSIRKSLETRADIPATTLEGYFPSWCREAVEAGRVRHEAIEVECSLDEVENVLQAEDKWIEAQAQTVPFASEAKAILRLALTEASNLGHEQLGTEHLLLGVLWGGDELTTDVLEPFHLDVVKIRKRVWAMTAPENGRPFERVSWEEE